MPFFRYQFTVRSPLEQVAAFHHSPAALRQLNPPPIVVQFHRIEPLAEGSRADFTLWVGPIPVRWRALHFNVDPLMGFSDIQEAGPFRSWEHRHQFRCIDAQTTEVSEEIQAEFGQGFWNGLVSRGMWLGLPVLFAFRAWATRRACEKVGSE